MLTCKKCLVARIKIYYIRTTCKNQGGPPYSLKQINYLLLNIHLDAANEHTNNIIEEIDMIEVKTDPYKSDELFSVCKNSNMVDNHSGNDKIESQSKNHILIHFYKNMIRKSKLILSQLFV